MDGMVSKTEAQLQSHEAVCAERYLKIKDAIREMKEDMRAGFSNVDKTLGLIFKKLDGKEDK